MVSVVSMVPSADARLGASRTRTNTATATATTEHFMIFMCGDPQEKLYGVRASTSPHRSSDYWGFIEQRPCPEENSLHTPGRPLPRFCLYAMTLRLVASLTAHPSGLTLTHTAPGYACHPSCLVRRYLYFVSAATECSCAFPAFFSIFNSDRVKTTRLPSALPP